MKIKFSYFLLIYSRCGALASWAERHTNVCLDLVTVLLEFPIALLEYLDLLLELCNLQIFVLLKLYNHFKMLALFLIPTHTYYFQNYAGIIAASLFLLQAF